MLQGDMKSEREAHERDISFLERQISIKKSVTGSVNLLFATISPMRKSREKKPGGGMEMVSIPAPKMGKETKNGEGGGKRKEFIKTNPRPRPRPRHPETRVHHI